MDPFKGSSALGRVSPNDEQASSSGVAPSNSVIRQESEREYKTV